MPTYPLPWVIVEGDDPQDITAEGLAVLAEIGYDVEDDPAGRVEAARRVLAVTLALAQIGRLTPESSSEPDSVLDAVLALRDAGIVELDPEGMRERSGGEWGPLLTWARLADDYACQVAEHERAPT